MESAELQKQRGFNNVSRFIRGTDFMTDSNSNDSPVLATEQKARKALHYQSALMELARLEHADLEVALRIITQTDAETLGLERVSVWFYNEDETEIVCRKLYQASKEEHSEGIRIAASSFPRYFEALRTKRAIAAHDAHTDPNTSEFSAVYLTPLGINSMLDVPVWRHGKMIGVVCHEHVGPARTWTEEEQDFAASVADMVSLSIEASERNKAENALIKAHQELQNAHEELEARVAQRTAELARTNAALQVEIAQRVRTQEELLQQTSQLEAIFRAFPDLYFRLDEDCTILAYHAGRTDVHVAPEKFMGKRMPDVLPPLIGEQFSDGVKRVLESMSLVAFEYSLPIQNGVRSFEARLLPLLDNQVMAIVRDITERKLSDETLRRNEERFRALIENVSDIITVLGSDGTMMYQSPAVERVLGYDAADLIGKNSLDFLHPDDVAPTVHALTRAAARPGKSQSSEFRFRHRDGHYLVLEAIGRTMLPDAADAGIVVNSRDITERKRVHEELEKAKEEAENANRAKSDFLSRMSHELRTPMNSILGFAQVLARKHLPPEQHKSVEHILKAGRHLLELINEVLDISRIEADRMRLSAEPVRLSHVVHETLNLIQHLATQRDCEIRDEVKSHGDPYVMADRQRLTQVLLNLVSNAVKYNRHGGTVTLTCQTNSDTRLRINVTDTGPGIAEENMEKLFSPFERLGAEQSEVEGTGLGLALSKRLVEVMGGSLGVESVMGEGSTFWVELAIAENPQERLQRTRGTPGFELISDSTKTCTVLYIEDNLANLSLIETIFAERPEIKLLSALQGRVGFDLAVEHKPDLILLDIHLPDISGDKVLARLKANERTREIPVVIVSADATEGHIQRMLDAGARSYLTKPLDVDRLLECVDEVLRAT